MGGPQRSSARRANGGPRFAPAPANEVPGYFARMQQSGARFKFEGTRKSCRRDFRQFWHTRSMSDRAEPERGVRLRTIYSSHALSHGLVLVFPAVMVTLRAEFGSSFTTLGTIATISTMLYGLGALPGGLLVDRLGAPLLLRIFAGLSVVFCLLAATAPGIWWLALALGLLGAAGALYHPSGLAEITLNVPGGGRVLGQHGSWGNLGTAVAPLLAGAIASAWTWRASYALGEAAAAKGGALSAAVLLLGVPGQLAGGRLAEGEGHSLALRYAGLYAGAIVVGVAVGWAGAGLLGLLLAGLFADRWGLAAVFALLGLVALLNALGGLVVRRLLGHAPVSTARPSRS